jgi:hypothetical protein
VRHASNREYGNHERNGGHREEEIQAGNVDVRRA